MLYEVITYDYWYHYLQICKKRNIPLLMISAVYRDGQRNNFV